MVKLTNSKASTKPALAKGKPKAAVAKPGKVAAKAAAKPAKIKYAEGDELLFNGYAKEQENPVFAADDRLTVTKVARDEDGNEVLECVKTEDYAAFKEDENSVEGDQVFATEVKKAPKEAADPYKELAASLTEDEKLTAFLAEHDDDPLAAANAAQEAVAENMFLLGGCLAKLYSDRAYLEYGDYADTVVEGKTKSGSGWEKFTDENFDMNGRKALSFISIYRNFNRLGDKIDLAEISSDKKIGWVKLGAMANYVNEENVEELIETARTQNAVEFAQTIKTDYAHGTGEATTSGPRVKRTTLKAVFYEDAGAHVTNIINQVGKKLNTEDYGTILEFIIIDWAHNSLGEKEFGTAEKDRKKKLTELKKAGVDTAERTKAYDDIMAMVNGGGDDEATGEDAEAETADAE